MRRWLSLGVSLLILAWLWTRIDVGAILAAMRGADGVTLLIGLAMAVPLTAVTAWRFGLLSRTPIGLGAATRLVLAASTLNLILPSKMGDIAKAWVLRRRYGFDGGDALALVVFEKMIDMAGILLWGVLALWLVAKGPLLLIAAAGLAVLLAALLVALSPLGVVAAVLRLAARRLPAGPAERIARFAAQWAATTAWFWANRRRAAGVWLVSIGLWAAHLVQVWLFARALGPAPLVGSMAAATLAILAGLLPFTIAGVGTRDAAIVLLFGSWLSPAQGAALGLLATTRYLIPALAGLPFVSDFWGRRTELATDAA